MSAGNKNWVTQVARSRAMPLPLLTSIANVIMNMPFAFAAGSMSLDGEATKPPG